MLHHAIPKSITRAITDNIITGNVNFAAALSLEHIAAGADDYDVITIVHNSNLNVVVHMQCCQIIKLMLADREDEPMI